MVPLLKEVKVRSLAFGQRQRYLLDKRGKTGSRRRPSISKIPKMAFSNVGALFFLLSHVRGSARRRAKQTEQSGQQTEQNGQFLGNNFGFIFWGHVVGLVSGLLSRNAWASSRTCLGFLSWSLSGVVWDFLFIFLLDIFNIFLATDFFHIIIVQ